MFDAALRAASSGVRGLKGVYLVGLDGIPVAGTGRLDVTSIEDLAASYAEVVRRISSMHADIDLEPADELVVGYAGGRVVYRRVGADYALLAVLGDAGSVGMARHRVRMAALALEHEL